MKLILVFFIISFITIVGTSLFNKFMVRKREEAKETGNENLINLGKHKILARKELSSRMIFSSLGLVFIGFGVILRVNTIIFLGGIVILGQSTYFFIDIYNFLKRNIYNN